MVTTTAPPTPPGGNISPVRIQEEMRTSYLTYAMSVIVSRALPDVRDGLKPVQRRILYAMHEMGIRPNSQHRKCARIAGEVLGKFHPHGESSVYDTLVRMAQPFSMRYPLIDGQGNFGSVDGDPPAAMRYTEARLASIADELLADIDQNTVDFLGNFDDSLEEPTVLPSRMPNMLVNGATGIAVGMATNIPPHNLGEICDAVCHLVDHPNCTSDDLIKLVPGPDFPTAGIIRGTSGIIETYNTGRGRIVMEAATEIEEVRGGRQRIVVTELPYQVNKAHLVEKIAHLTRDKKVDGITDIRDESDRHGMRVVIELRRDAQPNIVLNNLFKHTSLRTAFNSIVLALVDGQPQVLPLKRSLALFIEHRQEVIRRRSEFQLQRARDRDHIVQGLLLALDQIDRIIEIIRGSTDVEAARNNLMQEMGLSQVQAQAILDMQLRRLAALERERLEKEHEELLATIAALVELLANPAKILATIKTETRKLKKDFGNPRRTIIYPEEVMEQTAEQFIIHQDVMVTLSQRGYVKRVPCDTYKTQHRGGKGVRGMTTREDDALMDLVTVDTHDTLLFFTNKGRVYPLRVFQIPADTSRTTRGTLLINLIPLGRGEQVQAILRTQNPKEGDLLILATSKGEVKALKEGQLSNIQARGLIVMDLEDGDELVGVSPLGDAEDVVMVSELGQAIRFPVVDLAPRSRTAGGVRGMRLKDGDRVVSMNVVTANDRLLVVSTGGYGKSSRLSLYPTQSRNGQGVRTFKVTEKTGPVAIARVVPDTSDCEVFIISSKAQVVRINLEDVRTSGRATQGVIIWRDREPDDFVASVTLFEERAFTPTEPSTNGHEPTESEAVVEDEAEDEAE
ncbi:MAG: DNA gyrase subunit A [Chloroflexi bacterium]|nr:DNA gyrase subunit A [Chloroflexota bacterium]MDA1219395.1 DNA gyrase subunit A [Chloroflexota bacterium]